MPDAEDDLAAAREAARQDFAREQAEAGRAQAGDRNAGMRRGYARGRARDDAIRAQLTPLAPGERPLGLKLAVVVVLLICGANAIIAATDEHYLYAALFAVGGIALAAGLWARIYPVVLLVEALLGLAIIFAILALMLATTLLAALACIAVVVISAPVFWLLIRVMARLQVPRQ
ncbi:hypothetical protein OJ997_16200 [Solirubrobacter phytolaccae]|uniref:Uncharacterized protein n=1 Tax=Solirubrobacter phytolaccae TaxID=1404360 RepID=A0A9X3N9B9_9ACTN|nr:hypothetical protein [Solirubrobacter phytolaccae]MDA0181846.1 hypothetical protein [Solirubrobacter phytolaccae]